MRVQFFKYDEGVMYAAVFDDTHTITCLSIHSDFDWGTNEIYWKDTDVVWTGLSSDLVEGCKAAGTKFEIFPSKFQYAGDWINLDKRPQTESQWMSLLEAAHITSRYLD